MPTLNDSTARMTEAQNYGEPPATGGSGTAGDSVTVETTAGMLSSPGVATEYSRADHAHGTPAAAAIPDPAATVEEGTTFGLTPAVGTAEEYARADHQHGTPPDPGGTGVSGLTEGRLPIMGATTLEDSRISQLNSTTLEFRARETAFDNWNGFVMTATDANEMSIEPRQVAGGFDSYPTLRIGTASLSGTGETVHDGGQVVTEATGTTGAGKVTTEIGRVELRATSEGFIAPSVDIYTTGGALPATSVNIDGYGVSIGTGGDVTVNGDTVATVPMLTAATIVSTPAGGLAATDVQAALNELDTEKVGGTGTSTKLPKWTATSTLGDSIVTESGTTIGINETTPLAELHVSETGGAIPLLMLDGYGVSAQVVARVALGTKASPSAVTSGTLMGGFALRGYGATAFTTGARAYLIGYASENWTDAAQGTHWVFATTPIGGTAAVERIRIMDNGHILLNSGPRIITGAGTPEAAVAANVGSIYLRTDGGAGTSVYFKEAGTGNTGWVAK